MTVTKVLQEQTGIQYQGVQDKSEADPRDSLSNALFSGVFKRGRFDKPFKVTKETLRAKIGYDPENPYYVAVEDALEDGAPYIFLQRIGEMATETNRETRRSVGIEWSEKGNYLFVQDGSGDSLPFIRWFKVDQIKKTLTEQKMFITDSGHEEGLITNIQTSADETLVALYDSSRILNYKPDIFDISNPNDVKRIIVDPPLPFMRNNYQNDLLYNNGIQQVVFTEDNQYMLYVVYGNTGDDVGGLISVFKRSEDGTKFNLIKKLMNIHSAMGVGVSVVDSKMRIIGSDGAYIHAYVLDLETNDLTDLGYKDGTLHSGACMWVHKINEYTFIAETQFQGLAIIKFNMTNTDFSVEKIEGSYGGSRLLSYCHDQLNNAVVYYFGMDYSKKLVIGKIDTLNNTNIYDEHDVGITDNNLVGYFNTPKLSPFNKQLIAYSTDPNFFGGSEFVNFIQYNNGVPLPDGSYFNKVKYQIISNPGMEYIN
ncbi:hypothetical protein [Acinetobacter pittii]|uniref:hypothetical protein n=1 Tax=Acinetobacter pittii TaxID=48296 RepID=UPI00301D5161